MLVLNGIFCCFFSNYVEIKFCMCSNKMLHIGLGCSDDGKRRLKLRREVPWDTEAGSQRSSWAQRSANPAAQESQSSFCTEYRRSPSL